MRSEPIDVLAIKNMGSQGKDEFVNALVEKLLASVRNSARIAKMMRDLTRENERRREELQNKALIWNGSKSKATEVSVEHYGCKREFEALVEINHGWKQDYERLEIRCQMLNDEKRQLEYEKKNLRQFINSLEKRTVFLESENRRLATVIDAQQSRIGKHETELFCFFFR